MTMAPYIEKEKMHKDKANLHGEERMDGMSLPGKITDGFLNCRWEQTSKLLLLPRDGVPVPLFPCVFAKLVS